MMHPKRPNRLIPCILNAHEFDCLSTFLKITMRANFKWVIYYGFHTKQVSVLWRKLGFNTFMAHKLSKFFKTVEITIEIIFGLVENQRIFSTMTFMKTNLRNKLDEHLGTGCWNVL